MDDEKPQFRTVKYRQHGTLAKEFDFKTDEEFWRFETSDLTRDISGKDLGLITILADLSTEGFELVTGHDGEYILRTKEEIEFVQEYYTDEVEENEGEAMMVKEADTLMNKDEFPEILTAQIIATYLGISRRRVYELFQTTPKYGGIPNFDIGASKRVEKKDFLEWIEARKQEKMQGNSG